MSEHKTADPCNCGESLQRSHGYFARGRHKDNCPAREHVVMNQKEIVEHQRLLRLWASGKATAKQVSRCMELDRKAAAA